MIKNKIICSLFLLLSTGAFAQVGKTSFNFLAVPNNARLSALGGVNVSLADRDVNFMFSNPSLVSDTLAGWASATYQPYIAGVSQTTFSYLNNFKKVGMVAMGVQHIGYGNIKSYDASGALIGDFNSGETAVVIGRSHQINNFRLGLNLKAAFSNIAGYRSSAVMVDFGGVFIHPRKKLIVGLVMKNVGVVLSDYTTTGSSKLPIDLQIGTTFKPEHMPFQFSITGYNLVNSSVTYYNSQDANQKPGILDKALRRFNFGTELLIHRNVNLMVGYNFRQHQELKLVNGGGGAGITFGFSAKIKSSEFVFSRSGFVAGKAGYTFTISINTKKLFTRR